MRSLRLHWVDGQVEIFSQKFHNYLFVCCADLYNSIDAIMPHETDLVVGKKPGTVYSPADWFTSGYTISVNSGIQRDNSEQVN